tara:strand:+ start:595 stop:774 length:180 start_codon:yes stop_codon:yes gene_type:complete
MAEKLYRVANPKRIDPGVRILSCQGVSYYEGDEFAPPKKVNKAMLELWIREGYLEVSRG